VKGREIKFIDGEAGLLWPKPVVTRGDRTLTG
jgi:hypothetical protein